VGRAISPVLSADVTASTRQEVKAVDPLATSTNGFAYLYTSTTLTGA